MRGAGGSPGGFGQFVLGAVLAAGGLWLLLDSVRAVAAPHGVLSGWLGGVAGTGETTSQAALFVPFVLGLALLFYESRWRAGWALAGLGVLLIVVEVLSRVRFLLNTKLTALLLVLGLIAAGTGLMLRALRDQGPDESPDA